MTKPSMHETTPNQTVSPHRSQSAIKLRFVVVLVGVAVIAVLLFFVMRGDSQSTNATIGSSELTNIQTYLSENSNNTERTPRSEFTVGDQIQVGFSYSSSSEDDLVRFRVVNQDTNENVFETNLFRLGSEQQELFVNINNTSLPAGKYRVALVTADDNEAESVEYEISE